MSEGQRGQVPVRETFPQKGFPPIKSINCCMSTTVIGAFFVLGCDDFSGLQFIP
jgi:hypothetical protein